jgi:hypothetical protein
MTLSGVIVRLSLAFLIVAFFLSRCSHTFRHKDPKATAWTRLDPEELVQSTIDKDDERQNPFP